MAHIVEGSAMFQRIGLWFRSLVFVSTLAFIFCLSAFAEPVIPPDDQGEYYGIMPLGQTGEYYWSQQDITSLLSSVTNISNFLNTINNTLINNLSSGLLNNHNLQYTYTDFHTPSGIYSFSGNWSEALFSSVRWINEWQYQIYNKISDISVQPVVDAVNDIAVYVKYHDIELPPLFVEDFVLGYYSQTALFSYVGQVIPIFYDSGGNVNQHLDGGVTYTVTTHRPLYIDMGNSSSSVNATRQGQLYMSMGYYQYQVGGGPTINQICGHNVSSNTGIIQITSTNSAITLRFSSDYDGPIQFRLHYLGLSEPPKWDSLSSQYGSELEEQSSSLLSDSASLDAKENEMYDSLNSYLGQIDFSPTNIIGTYTSGIAFVSDTFLLIWDNSPALKALITISIMFGLINLFIGRGAKFLQSDIKTRRGGD